MLLAALKRYPVFTVRDIANVLNKQRDYAYTVAYRLKKAGAIHEIEKGKYTLEEDSFLIASWITWPSYISSWAALNYHKLTEQLPFIIHVITTRKRKNKIVIYGNSRITFIKIKKNAFFGFERVIYQNKEIFIAEKEKALVDAIATKKMSLGEAVDIIKNNVRKINKTKLFSYAKITKGLVKKLKRGLNQLEQDPGLSKTRRFSR